WFCYCNAERLGSLPQIRRLDPEHPTVATRTSAEGLHRRDVDVRLGEFLRDRGDRPPPIVSLYQEPALLLAQLELCAFGRLHESGTIFRDEIRLGSTQAVWKRRG